MRSLSGYSQPRVRSCTWASQGSSPPAFSGFRGKGIWGIDTGVCVLTPLFLLRVHTPKRPCETLAYHLPHHPLAPSPPSEANSPGPSFLSTHGLIRNMVLLRCGSRGRLEAIPTFALSLQCKGLRGSSPGTPKSVCALGQSRSLRRTRILGV